ncbi:MAG: hypothetical protein QOF33_3919 [Thermomicrobiales bacterium]|jgi:hypothetical protein|nr:hypothetical protein [Thermomicrobiales bacterium]
MVQQQPKWLRLTEQLLDPIACAGGDLLDPTTAADPDVAAVPYCALIHLVDCLQTIDLVNKQGKHSVAVCLLRQGIEAMTLIDLGLQDESFSYPLLQEWKSDSKSQGQIRATLEQHVWPGYGTGLWQESWADYFGNLARSAQPYAHYTEKLLGWQLGAFGFDGDKRFFATMGPNNYDPMKASRITLLISLTGWTLARLLLTCGRSPVVSGYAKAIHDWGAALATSNLLFHEEDWGKQLVPHVLFRTGCDWRDV